MSSAPTPFDSALPTEKPGSHKRKQINTDKEDGSILIVSDAPKRHKTQPLHDDHIQTAVNPPTILDTQLNHSANAQLADVNGNSTSNIGRSASSAAAVDMPNGSTSVVNKSMTNSHIYFAHSIAVLQRQFRSDDTNQMMVSEISSSMGATIGPLPTGHHAANKIASFDWKTQLLKRTSNHITTEPDQQHSLQPTSDAEINLTFIHKCASSWPLASKTQQLVR